jgi:hypothetical protein
MLGAAVYRVTRKRNARRGCGEIPLEKTLADKGNTPPPEPRAVDVPHTRVQDMNDNKMKIRIIIYSTANLAIWLGLDRKLRLAFHK